MQKQVTIQTEEGHKYEQRDKTNPWWKWGGMKWDLEVSPDLKFFKKFTQPNFTLQEFYTLKRVNQVYFCQQ